MGLKRLAKDSFDNFRGIEFFLALTALWWSLLLFDPIDTFSTSSSYKVLANITSENVWGAYFLALAVIHFIGMILNCKRIKRLGLIAAMGIWTFVGVGIYLGNPIATGSGSYIAIAALCGWLYVKVGGQE
jgi:hypothetical protein